MSINIKEELIYQFCETKMAGTDDKKLLLGNFYDFLEQQKFNDKLKDCEIELMKLLNNKYKNLC